MGIPKEALELECRYQYQHDDRYPALGAPTLFDAFKILRDYWQCGHRDRETALHLVFLGWYMDREPNWETGYVDSEENYREISALMGEALEYLEPVESEDAEILFVFAIMAKYPWRLVGNLDWDGCGQEFQRRYLLLEPKGLDPSNFDGRGLYGQYFAQYAQDKYFVDSF